MNTPFISIIIPVYNGSKTLERLISSLSDQTYPLSNYEIIIVDNNSTDSTKEICSKFNVVYLTENKIQSSYAARNRGIQFAKGDILAFTDADCLPSKSWLSDGVECLYSSSADMVGGNIQFIVDRNNIFNIYDSIYNLQIERSIKQRGAAVTANLFIRNEIFSTLGLFDQHAISGADIAFTLLATKSGYNLIFCPNAIIKHHARDFSELYKKAKRTSKGKAYWRKKVIHTPKNNTYNLLQNHFNFVNVINRVKKEYPKIKKFKIAELFLIHFFMLAVSLACRVFTWKK